MLQLSTVQKPGSSHGCRQFDEEASIFPFGNFTAFEATLDLWTGYYMEKLEIQVNTATKTTIKCPW